MEIYYSIMAFIFGTVLGSFYNVVGYRLPRNQSLIKPASHCTNCNHRLGASELVPIFSYIFQGGRCKNCKANISPFYMTFELLTGILFMLSYIIFGPTYEFIIAIIFVSMAIIIIISDYQTMIIPDEVLIVSGILILICQFLSGGISLVIKSLSGGIIAFSIMILIKMFGDYLFKKESMGGGDIKLMFIFGMVLGWQMSIISIFLASFIALPISLILYLIKKENIIPFGPFLCISALIILLSKIDFNFIINLLTK